ncbi:hypothetical protein GCM10022225_72420 [Plantactinospora mayteni]|uniref:Uncharacterized protein n=1 Tax=Plantactinospora mayteni TaxID=566021 RepID=A0ABQ4F199_9ACTN|nr:hypothetical protein [Plantactinospora mayteni]GIH00696.1 hypothetical protein Pma05_72680 [Plantactinospora mayteni]
MLARNDVFAVGPVMTPTRRLDREQIIGVLIPAPLPARSRPGPAPMPALPAPRPPATASLDEVLIGVARPDRSGRVTEHSLLGALRWPAGHRIDIRPHSGMLVVSSASAGQHVVGSRGELPLPASVRQMCAIVPGQPLLLAALVAHDLLVIHPANTVVRLLVDLHAQVVSGRRVC